MFTTLKEKQYNEFDQKVSNGGVKKA